MKDSYQVVIQELQGSEHGGFLGFEALEVVEGALISRAEAKAQSIEFVEFFFQVVPTEEWLGRIFEDLDHVCCLEVKVNR